MKLLMSVFVIRFIAALFDNKAKANSKNMQKDDGQKNARHPAAFQVR